MSARFGGTCCNSSVGKIRSFRLALATQRLCNQSELHEISKQRAKEMIVRCLMSGAGSCSVYL